MQGLEQRRRCGFLPEGKRGPARLVWVQGKTGTDECPKSLTTAASAELVERFFVWKASGAGSWDKLSAREADAFVVLEEEWRTSSDSGVANGK